MHLIIRMIEEKELDDLALRNEKKDLDDSTLKDDVIPMSLLQDNEKIKKWKRSKILTLNNYSPNKRWI